MNPNRMALLIMALGLLAALCLVVLGVGGTDACQSAMPWVCGGPQR